jgi:predicted metal-dependent hydrolase
VGTTTSGLTKTTGSPPGPARGIDLFNRGLYWEAHEAWEEVWMPDRRGPDRGFYKGLIQIAAGCLHYGRRNRRGTLNKWRSGADYLRPYLPRHRGVELLALVERTDELLSAVTGAREWPEGLAMPLIQAKFDLRPPKQSSEMAP